MTDSPATTRLSKRRTYRRLMYGSVLGGTAVSLLLRYFDYPLVGEAVYWVGLLAFFVIWKGSDVQLMDERDWALERRASLTALQLVVAVAVPGAAALRLLTWLTDYTAPPIVRGAFYGYIGLFIAFGLSYLWHRSRL
ncbi:DUF2178 domain-containing protein [Haloarcula sp. S1CR25-12]|uniref:DUF2178 domain-containing protein n=1 Tax=Haloarcula saliterrae TaxID=2950534 RepID=A0ABU2F811_9EURY|nr:DUF2178 domain-containing protein [Haloarcula sp. S1CR25-12]MDS0258384.1 DUF2178 domain-containing protein [Haloarcula sp. S1CR25-12]